MEFDEIVVKESPGLCRCCLSEGCYKDMGTEYTWMNENEVYADMLLECFDISVSQHNEGPNGPNRLICEVCITRLRDACNFKKQVLDSEKKFVDMIGRGEFGPKVLIYPSQMKSEAEDATVNEVEYLDDGDMDFGDDEPLKPSEEPSISDITVSSLPIKNKRGRPKKAVVKTEKKAKVAKLEEKAKSSKSLVKDENGPAKVSNAKIKRRQNLLTLFNNTSLIPFKWRARYMCFYCGQHLADPSKVRKHTKSHGPCTDKDRSIRLIYNSNVDVKIDVSIITCDVCDTTLNNIDDVIDHLTKQHNLPYHRDVEMTISCYRLVDLQCLYCDQSFGVFNKLVTHVNSNHHINNFSCHDCNQQFNTKRDLESHCRFDHKTEFSCDVCKESFANFAQLHKHKQDNHILGCDKCLATFTFDSERLNHMATKHPLGTNNEVPDHTTKCKVEGHSKDDKKASVTDIRNNIACILNMSTAVPFKFFLHQFRCFYCSKDFSDSDLLKQHTVLEHPHCDTRVRSLSLRNRKDGVRIKVDVSTLSCKLCLQPINALDTLIDHLISEHKAEYDKSVDNYLDSFKLIKDNYPCPSCHEVFKCFGNLLRHVSSYHADNKIVCVHCGMCFRTDPNLRAHMNRHHKPHNHKCTNCDISFATNDMLQLHLGKVHGTKIAICDMCSEQFSSRTTMRRHQITAHGVGHKCDYCGKLFAKNSVKEEHIRRLHLKEKNVNCPLCSECFFDMTRLKMHMVKHAGERNFHCDICDKKFLWKKNLRAHMTMHVKKAHVQYEYAPGPYDGCASERRRKNLRILFNNTTIIPFKWRGKFLCFYCAKSYSEYPEFRKHTKSHGPCTTKDYALKVIKGNHIEIKVDVSEIICDICNEPFGSMNEIIDHLVGKHGMEYDKSVDIPFQAYRLLDFKCLCCDQQFSYFGSLVSHVNIMHPQNSFICDDCGATFNKKRDLAVHMRNLHRQGGYACDQCTQNFDTYYSLRTHQNTAHFRKCKNCSLHFLSPALLQKHMKAEHPEDGNVKCSFCGKECHSKNGLAQHMARCKVKLIAQPDEPPIFDSFPTEVGVKPRKKQNILQIRQNIQCVLNMSTAIPFKFFSKFSCFYCSKKFTEFEELKDHTIMEHPICELKSKCMKKCKGERITVKIDIACLSCKICSQPMSELDALIDHLIFEHKANYDKSFTRCFEPFKLIKDNLPCPVCPERVFRYFATLLKHLNAEHSNNNRICDFCGRCFRNVANLKVHISYAHTGCCECTICGAKYKNQWCLARHRAKVHNAKDYGCTKCPEKFPSAYHRQKHLIKAHDIGHKCTYCGRMFTRNSFMKDHIRRTHLREKNVPCSVCNERFFDNYLLRMHMVKHDGERKFTCDVCGKAFLRRSNLQSHMDMHKKYGHVSVPI